MLVIQPEANLATVFLYLLRNHKKADVFLPKQGNMIPSRQTPLGTIASATSFVIPIGDC